jgi:GGDEF domain-containing protein
LKITIILGFIICILLGGVISVVIFGRTTSSSLKITGLAHRVDWEERATQAYKEEDSSTAIWALINLSEILEKDKDTYIDDKRDIQIDLVLTYGRLALLYKKENNINKYEKNISKALKIAKEVYGSNMDEVQVLEFIHKVDSRKSKDS